jgi:hypothetical protein
MTISKCALQETGFNADDKRLNASMLYGTYTVRKACQSSWKSVHLESALIWAPQKKYLTQQNWSFSSNFSEISSQWVDFAWLVVN